MKSFALLLLPLASAALVTRQQVATSAESCTGLCLAAAIGDSVTQPRFGLAPQDIGCLCSDSGFVTSYNNCVKEICLADFVPYIQESLVNECKKAGVPLNETAVVTSTTTTSSPAASPTGTATGTASTIFLLPMPLTTGSAYSSVVSAASSVLAGTTLPSVFGAPAATTSADAKSAGSAMRPELGIAMGLSAAVVLGYLAV